MLLLGLMKPPWILVGTILAPEFFPCTIGAGADSILGGHILYLK